MNAVSFVQLNENYSIHSFEEYGLYTPGSNVVFTLYHTQEDDDNDELFSVSFRINKVSYVKLNYFNS